MGRWFYELPNTNNAIATTGSFNTVVNNNGSGTSTGAINYDGFVALITSSGGRTASTYYGAVQQDRVLGVAHDPISDAVIAVGRTNSVNTTGNLLASTSGFNTVLNNGSNNTAFDDGFVVRLTVSGTTMNRDWGSYWGSTGDDYLTSVAVDDNNVTAVSPNTAANGTGGKIFVAGTTTQSSGAFASYNFDASFNSNQGASMPSGAGSIARRQQWNTRRSLDQVEMTLQPGLPSITSGMFSLQVLQVLQVEQ